MIDQETLVDLYRTYRRSNRFYHDANHIASCFAELNAALADGVKCENIEALRLALWFHDYVYEGQYKDNKERSAVAAYKAAMRLSNNDEGFAETVKNLVLVTKHSVYFPTTPDEQLICDLDLASLAAPAEQFDANSEAIRKEYAFVPDELFHQERRKILTNFNLRIPLYYTQYFRDLYEARAHENLTRATA